MRQSAPFVHRPPDPKLAELRLPAAELQQFRSLLRDLLAQRARGGTEQWWESVLRSLRALTGSDKAMLVVRTAKGPATHGVGVTRELLSMYLNQFSDLDRSRVALRDHGLEAWSLDLLWQPAAL